jgi:hypothetical protein
MSKKGGARTAAAGTDVDGGGSTVAQRAMPLTWRGTGSDGLLRESDGRRLYDLLGFLGAAVLPALNAARLPKSPVAWNARDSTRNDTLTRMLVNKFVLAEISRLADEVDSGTHDALARKVLGRRLTATDKAEIRGLGVHVEDDFYVVGYVADGAILVQVPVAGAEEKSSKEFLQTLPPRQGVPTAAEGPRVFVVRGLATPLEDLFAPIVEEAVQGGASGGRRFARVHTVLMPFGSRITYMTTVTPALGSAPQKELDRRLSVALGAYGASNEGRRPVYRTLELPRDAHLVTTVSH